MAVAAASTAGLTDHHPVSDARVLSSPRSACAVRAVRAVPACHAAAVMSKPLAEACSDLVTSVIVGRGREEEPGVHVCPLGGCQVYLLT